MRKRIIGPKENPYMIQWILFRTRAFGIYLHKFLRSDYERALHDHPWPFLSVILRGGYYERHDQTRDHAEVVEWRGAGSVLLRPAQWRHRVILRTETQFSWSLVFVGRRAQQWGFYPDGKWCWWRKFDPDLGICADQVLWTEGED
jgi:hypothetical protein